MSKLPKLVFFGNERLATGVSTDVPALRALIKDGYEVAAVVASHSEGVSRQRRGLEIVEVAHAYHIPVLIPDKFEDITERLAKTSAQAGILVAFGKIIPQTIIDIFPKGIINIHPSLLPKYRGPTPVETAILDGASQTGVSLMALSAKMDAGPVYLQQPVELDGNETKPQLAKKLLAEGVNLLSDNLAYILDGTLEPIPQAATEATYTKLLTKQDGWVDFDEPAELIERKVRAFLGFPKTRAKVLGQEIVITKARVAKNAKDGALVVKARPGFLEIKDLIGPSGRIMSGADYIRGYKRS
ncbi:methionyl-tRNA formyltransferase [Candidatus Saccharibacteria bacterium]|nr:methionyl-tRNA formyltransferase [Candidatus Saccharibacteria bacterium]